MWLLDAGVGRRDVGRAYVTSSLSIAGGDAVQSVTPRVNKDVRM